MHLQSGLLEQVDETTVRQVGPLKDWHTVVDQLVEMARAFPEPPILLGHSVQFDRAWLEHHAPEVTPLISYRNLDARAFDLAAGGRLLDRDAKPHRALDDVRISIETCRQGFRRLRDRERIEVAFRAADNDDGLRTDDVLDAVISALENRGAGV